MTSDASMKRYRGSAFAYRCEDEGDSCPLAQEDGCSCRQEAPGCPCHREDEAGDDDCCCKASMVEALELLCSEDLARAVDFDAFFFLTDALAVGSPLACPGKDIDNISSPKASLQRFSPCNCDLLDVSGTAYFAVPCSECTALENLEQLTLCSLKAVAFQVAEDDDEDDEERCCCRESRYRRAVRNIRRAIRAEGGDTGACGSCGAHCDCSDCCCTTGVIRELSSRNLSRQATLTVGPLVLQNVTVLGSIGSVLVLASEELCRFYFVCANAVEAIA